MTPARKEPAAKKAPGKASQAKKSAPTRNTASTRKTAPARKRTPAKKEVPVTPEVPMVDEPHDEAFQGDDWGGDWGELGWDEPDPHDSADGPDPDPRRGRTSAGFPDATERFQEAARELIDAARAMLDIAEEAIDDPQAIRATFGSMRAVAEDLFRSAARSNPMARPTHGDGDPDDFQHIPVD